jgi:hypothetical protein
MNKKFSDRLNEFLETECDDYGISFTWEENPDINCVVATIRRGIGNFKVDVNFRYEEKTDTLLIELSEDNYCEVCEYEYSVKYFWMAVAPYLFPVN